MTHVTCRLTAKNQDQLRNPTLGNRVWATFTLFLIIRSGVNRFLPSVTGEWWGDLSDSSTLVVCQLPDDRAVTDLTFLRLCMAATSDDRADIQCIDKAIASECIS